MDLLASTGVAIQPAPRGGAHTGVFLTNAALCLKRGGAAAKVNRQWFANCATVFLRSQINLVKPQVVVTLGEQAYRAVRLAFDLPRVSFRRAARRQLSIPLTSEIQLVPVYHCGQRILNTHRPPAQQFEDWRLVGSILNGAHKPIGLDIR